MHKRIWVICMKKSKVNQQINIIQFIFMSLFLFMIGYLIYFNIKEAPELITHSYNTARLNNLADDVTRGSILARDGEVLAKTETGADGEEVRVYPYERMFAHVVGYNIKGKSGLESSAQSELIQTSSSVFEKILNDLNNETPVGNSVITTLDYDLQKIAYEGLGDKQGAIVAMDPNTGEILAMVSKPDFNPNDTSGLEEIMSSNTGSSLLNRATSGKYPPGSTFKVVTTLAYMRDNKDWANYTYTCTGRGTFYGNEIECYNGKAHGEVNLEEALACSCNTFFAQLGVDMNLSTLEKTAEELLFNQSLPLGSKSSYTLSSSSTDAEAPQTTIGQGNTLVSPYHNLLIVSAIANDGLLMEPHLISSVVSDSGEEVKSTNSKSYERLMTETEAQDLTQMMISVVEDGTAKSGLQGLSFSAAGKTGSAEHAEGKDAHGWFIGFAPAEDPQIAVSIIVEEGESGSKSAVPIAKEMFESYVK